MNFMRRDNPTVPDNYYMHSFIAGLNPCIQSHLECLEPASMQKAMWLARTIVKSCPPVSTATPKYYNPQKNIVCDSPKPTVISNAPAATVIQRAREKGVCYKCIEPWFPGHK